MTTALRTIEVGCEVRCKPVSRDGGGRRDADGFAIGGIVVEIKPGHTDRETGETFPDRYVVYDRSAAPGHKWHELDAGEIDPDSVRPGTGLATVVRQFAYILGDTKHWRRLHLDQREDELVRYMFALAHAEAAHRYPAHERHTREEEKF